MVQLTWSDYGKRYFETGTDRGVLYVNGNGVAWNGLVSVNEAPTGGDAKPYYFDGFKFANISAAEEYEATITAFDSPAEFRQCDGIGAIATGLFVNQQPRKKFNFVYRTLIGNDDVGVDFGYKIHIVYNALAAPPSRDYSTVDSSVTPTSFAWGITTSPISFPGFKPSAHLVVDSRETPPIVLSQLEGFLYGTESTEPSLPDLAGLLVIFDSFVPYAIMPVDGLTDVYNIYSVDAADANALISPVMPDPIPGKVTLWLDSSNAGYVVPTAITEDIV